MSTRLQICLLMFLIIIMLILISELRKKSIDIRYSLSWLLLDVVLIIFVIFPNSLAYISQLIGIATPVNMLFVLGFILAMVVIYTLTVAVSKLSDNVRQLSQHIALNNHEEKENEQQ